MSGRRRTAPAADAPSCFGFAARSDERFCFTRIGGGQEVLDICELRGAPPEPDEPPMWAWRTSDRSSDVYAKLYASGGIFALWLSDLGWFRIAPADGTIEIPVGGDPARREQVLWGMPAQVCFQQRGDLALHAAAAEVAGGAVLFAAPGRFGKTTLAVAFHEAGYRLLSEDLARCRLDGEPMMYPGPAIARVRSDVASTVPPAGMHVAWSSETRVYLAVDEALRGDSAPLPIRAVVFLREAADRVEMEPVGAPDAIRDLWALAMKTPTPGDRRRSFEQIVDLASSVPVYNLHRPLELDRVDETVARIVKTCAP